jgi:oxepin-CoA hydrolase / 3-oxo-5,6-dehydrosuberyl-CoA semialdehyde dehydrogenase
MGFISTDLETIIRSLDKLSATTQPQWGAMNAQRMVEHLTEGLQMSIGIGEYQLLIPEDKIDKMKAILASDEPMPRGFKVPFAPEKYELRNEELELAVDELIENWLAFEEYYEENPTKEHLHPYYGMLDKNGWLRIHEKHFTHHFEQFGLL